MACLFLPIVIIVGKEGFEPLKIQIDIVGKEGHETRNIVVYGSSHALNGCGFLFQPTSVISIEPILSYNHNNNLKISNHH